MNNIQARSYPSVISFRFANLSGRKKKMPHFLSSTLVDPKSAMNKQAGKKDEQKRYGATASK
jgi:hypothetical protein